MAGRPDAFMPLYIGDYLADTGHLTTAEHGAYLLLLMHYWRTGKPLSAEDGVLSRIAKMPRAEWDSIKGTVRDFFTVTVMDTVTVLTHSRVEAEMEHAKGKYQSRKAASERANAAKKAAQERMANREGDRNGDRHADRDATQSQSQSQSQDTSSFHSDVGKPERRRVRKGLPEGFPFQTDQDWAATYWLQHGRADLCSMMSEEISKFRDHHTGKLTASADWPGSWRTWARNAIKFNNGGHNGRRNDRPSAHENFAAGALAAAEDFGRSGS